jgi:hypothetical protein
MLNRRGREARIDERTLFTGPEKRARAYASEELLNYWETHPRPTEAYFQGADTRIGYGTVTGVKRRMTPEEQAGASATTGSPGRLSRRHDRRVSIDERQMKRRSLAPVTVGSGLSVN